MKPIDEMTLAECLALLRKERMPIVMENGKVYHGMFDHQHRIEIADRIHDLTPLDSVERTVADRGGCG